MTTALIVLCTLVVILAIVAIAALASARRPLSLRAQETAAAVLDARAADLESYATSLGNQSIAFADALREQAEMFESRIGQVLDALTDDRQRLLTAVLATSNPNAAVLLGRTDEVRARREQSAEREYTMRQFLDDTRDERVRESETTDSLGNPIIPVGLGSQ